MSTSDEVFNAVMQASAPAHPDRDEAVDALIRDRVKAWDQLDREHFPPLHWAIPGLIPEGYGLLVAPPKAGKSWMVLDFAIACAAGGAALNAVNATARPVLYLALEDGDRRLQDRLRVLSEGRGIQPTPNLLRVLNADALEADVLISEFIRDRGHERPLIILDTIGKVMPGKSGGENEYQRDYRFGSKLKSYVAAMPGGTLLGVHHTNKGQHDDFQNAVSGTQGIAGAADFAAVIRRSRGEDSAILSLTGRDVREAEYAMKFDAGLWTLDGDGLDAARERAAEVRAAEKDDVARSRLGDRITEIIAHVNAKAGEVVSPAEIAAAFDLKNDAAGKYLKRAERSGHIRSTGRGKYVSNVSNVSKPQVGSEFSRAALDTLDSGVQSNGDVTHFPGQHVQGPLDTLDGLDTFPQRKAATTDVPARVRAWIDDLPPGTELSPETVVASFPDHQPGAVLDALDALADAGRITRSAHGYGPNPTEATA